MIPASAVKEYLDRELDTHLWVKRLSARQLDEALSRLDPKPRLNPGLRLHQKACFLLGVAFPKFCFWLDMGTGKTVLALELIRYWMDAGIASRALVFVTSDKAFPTWENQIERFKIGVPVVALEGSSERKWRQLEEFDRGIVLLPYPGALAMTSTRVKKGRKGKMQLDTKLVARLRKWADVLVLDESTKVGNHQSLTYKLVNALRKKSVARYALAGRPFGRDPTMLWPQYNLIDDGETLGETLGMFRAAFFKEKESYWSKSKYARDYKFDKAMRPKLSSVMQHRSIAYSADECIDLPRVNAVSEMLTLPDETRAYYSRLVQELIESKGNFREVKNVFLRMRQLSSGFIGLKDDETGEKAEIVFDENPKLERLLELLEEVPEGRKAVVFYAFTLSGRTIVERLRELKRKPIWLWSGTKSSRKELEAFCNDPARDVAVVNNQLAAMSLDGLQRVANYDFFYESPVSIIDREQAERRLVRDGQERPVFRYDLLVRKTVDEKIRAFHKEGGDLMRALMRDPEKLLV